MTELESLRAELPLASASADASARTAEQLRKRRDCMLARIAELEREPQRWRPAAGESAWWVEWDGIAYKGKQLHTTFNAFPTEERAKEVATHFRRLGLAAQWGALLTEPARADVQWVNRVVASGGTWYFVFASDAQRDGFMADAKREGLL